MKTKIGTIDMTPTWAEILPALLLVSKEGNASGQKMAGEELERMAKIADAYVAQSKTVKFDMMTTSVKMIEDACHTGGLVLMKSINNPDNVGMSPALVLVNELSKMAKER